MVRLIALLLVLLLGITSAQDPGLDLPVLQPGTSDQEIQPPRPDEDVEDIPEPIILYGEEIVVSDTIVFILDRSGSMHTLGSGEVQPNGRSRFGVAVDELERAIQALSERVRFSVVAYDHIVEVWSPDLVPASQGNKSGAIGWLHALYARGGTETAAGTLAGLGLGERAEKAVLVTDGAPSGPPNKHREAIRNGNTKPAVIDVFGISATDATTRGFCQGVAADSGGRYVDVR